MNPNDTANKELLNTLRNIVGPDHVLDSHQVRLRATHFWDSSPLQAMALVRPKNTIETSEVLKACHEANQVVVTHGGVTGLVDGNLSTCNDIILSMERQHLIEAIDPVCKTMHVQAGAKLQTVQEHAAQAGLQLGLDLGARGSCTIGGNVSTNAGGLSVLRYGMMREQVLGLEAVLADGTVVSSMNSMMKNNAGYDIKQLFIGSEGTLGIITRVVLRLRADTPHISTALLGFSCFANVTKTLTHLDNTLNGTLDAFEVIWKPFFQLNTNPARRDTARAPISRDYPIYAIVESRSANAGAQPDLLQSALETCMTQGDITDAAIAQSKAEAANIWHIREHIDIALEPDPVFVYDISLPITAMESYVNQLNVELSTIWPHLQLYVYGHLADGNLHVLVAPPATNQSQENSDAVRERWREQSNKLVYGPLQAFGGSVSAEHGIGLSKKPYLAISRNHQEIALMQLLKKTMDPKSILNPGKIIDV